MSFFDYVFPWRWPRLYHEYLYTKFYHYTGLIQAVNQSDQAKMVAYVRRHGTSSLRKVASLIEAAREIVYHNNFLIAAEHSNYLRIGLYEGRKDLDLGVSEKRVKEHIADIGIAINKLREAFDLLDSIHDLKAKNYIESCKRSVLALRDHLNLFAGLYAGMKPVSLERDSKIMYETPFPYSLGREGSAAFMEQLVELAKKQTELYNAVASDLYNANEILKDLKSAKAA